MSALLSVDPQNSDSAARSLEIAVFPTQLGWIAFAMRQQSLVRLVFGYSDAETASNGLAKSSGFGPGYSSELCDAKAANFISCVESVQKRLVRFADGEADDFADLQVWSSGWTSFQRQVLNRCRQISYGETRTYAELAAAAGRPGAARAVGRAMATNPIPLVIPCHRVVGSAGELRGFSAIGGLDAKRRLLALERGESAPALR
ncbi:MAG TPA: methylated-DNA--[protein]-cysteine S-methyltransferase [Pirellulales bacterium]|jgi:methylated-DNA-[protein]-cysteine S-methyltransferase|nr:methylated-DNA--[protein]-cysteine S-methyltransferase [Pirellulales bacterium]